jgi:hypothetical protein
MTKVTLLREGTDSQEMTYRAVGGHAQAVGRTMGEAVDALASRLDADQSDTLIIVRELRPDRFFPASARRRLEELMVRWRSARDAGTALSDNERAELDRLSDDEVRAATERAAEIWRGLAR